MKNKKSEGPDAKPAKRTYLAQEDLPGFTLEEALAVPRAIVDNYGKQPTSPLGVAQALDYKPTTGLFRSLCGAAMYYGLTSGGAWSAQIALTELGRRTVAPTEEGDDLRAKREAVLRPRIAHEFLTKYKGAKLPPPPIAKNVLESLGVPAEQWDRSFKIIVANAKAVGFLRTIKDSDYVEFDTGSPAPTTETNGHSNGHVNGLGSGLTDAAPAPEPEAPPSPNGSATKPGKLARPEDDRVFITHGKNHDVVSQLKELLGFGKFVPVVAMEQESVSQPVPDKVMADMRTCSAAIIHVGTEMELLDAEGNKHRVLNPNVLIEIGAAMALFNRRFILLVEIGVTLPSNLQGLYEVRYEGSKLDYEATMKLLKALTNFRLT